MFLQIGAGDAMQRRAQSFETGYLYPSADPDLINPVIGQIIHGINM